MALPQPKRHGGCWLSLPLLAGFALEALASIHPDCRKSPELHFQDFPDGSQRLIAFGGKGYAWQKKGHHGASFEAPIWTTEDDEDFEEEHGGAPLIGRRLKKWKKKVRMFGDTWAFDLETASWEPVHLPWEIFNVWGNSPAPRWKPSSAAIQNNTGIVLFGGCKSTNVAGVMDDFWLFRPTSCCPAHGRWRRIVTWNTPRARRGHVAVAFHKRFIVYGGKGYNPVAVNGSNSECLRDLWMLEKLQWHGKPEAEWVRGPDFPGGCRWGATGSKVIGPDGREYLALFGGRNLNSNFTEHTASDSAYTYYNELWLFDPEARSWTLQQPEGPRPWPRDHHGAAMVGGDLFVFGGRISEKRTEDAVVGDLWSYSISTNRWRRHQGMEGVSPSSRYMPGVARVSWRGEDALSVFAGETLPGSTKKTTLNDVWVFSPSNSTWTMLFEADCSRVELSETVAEGEKEESVPTQRLALGAETLSCLIAAGLIVTLGLKLWRGRFGQAVARCRLSGEAESVTSYECMG